MRLVWGGEAFVVPFVARLTGCARGFGECRTAAVLANNGDLAAGLVFHNWNPEAGVIEVSAAAVHPAWAQRGVLREAFGYVFSSNQMAVARCAEDNNRVRRLWRAFGATEIVMPRGRGRNAAEIICTLTDDAWSASAFMR